MDEIKTSSEMIKIGGQHRRQMAIMLKLSTEKIQEIEVQCTLRQLEEEKTTYLILEEWKNRNGVVATRKVLKDVLLEVGKKDVVHEIFTNVKEDPGKMKAKYKDVLLFLSSFVRRNRNERIETLLITQRLPEIKIPGYTYKLLVIVGFYYNKTGVEIRCSECEAPVWIQTIETEEDLLS